MLGQAIQEPQNTSVSENATSQCHLRWLFLPLCEQTSLVCALLKRDNSS